LLSGDVFARYYKLKGYEVLHVSGSDAHGTTIEYEALKKGLTPKELADQVHQQILEIIKGFDIDMYYTTTESPTHYRFVQDIYKKIEANGYIFSKEEERAYCTNCKKFLADRFIVGTCPHCGFEDARGNQCDTCGALLEPEELKNPKCAICGKSYITFKKTRNWYLDLKKLEPKLREYVDSRNFQSNVKKFTENMLEGGLEPRAITRDIAWGIPAPFAGAQGKVIYVWAEAALGYVSATMEYFQKLGEPERWKEFWFGEDVKQIYTQGKDNIPFHTIVFPGQLIASGEGYHLPDQIAAIEYLNWIGGQRFSKSRNIGIYCDDALELFDPIYWRFYLLYVRPERKDVHFSWEELEKAVNAVFIDNISNLINRVIAFTNKSYDSLIPEAPVDQTIFTEIKRVKEEVEKNIEAGLLGVALRRIAELAVIGNEYFQREKPWEGEKSQVVTTALHLVKAMAILLEPFVPSFSHRVYRLLNLKRPSFEDILKVDTGRKIGKAQVLLEKLDMEAVKEKYAQLKGEGEGEGEKRVSLARFQELDLRVGVIIKAEEIAGADKLYKLTIDVGRELITVAGLKKDYAKEELMGRKVLVLTNLEPVIIRGVRSSGMILAAQGERLALLQPDREVRAGTKVK